LCRAQPAPGTLRVVRRATRRADHARRARPTPFLEAPMRALAVTALRALSLRWSVRRRACAASWARIRTRLVPAAANAAQQDTGARLRSRCRAAKTGGTTRAAHMTSEPAACPAFLLDARHPKCIEPLAVPVRRRLFRQLVDHQGRPARLPAVPRGHELPGERDDR